MELTSWLKVGNHECDNEYFGDCSESGVRKGHKVRQVTCSHQEYIYIYILKNNKISTAPDEFQRLLCSCVGLCFCDPVLREMDAAAPHRVSPPIPHV